MKKLQLPANLPHLTGSLGLAVPDGQLAGGMCFHRTVGFVLDVPMAKLCVGIFRAATAEELAENPELSPEPFIHCWPEVGEQAFLLSRIDRRQRMVPRAKTSHYYAMNGTTNVVRMSRKPLLHLSSRYGLAQHLLYHAPLVGDAKFGQVILDYLGVGYRISDRGGLVPGSSKGNEPL